LNRSARVVRGSRALPPLGEGLEFIRLLWAIDHGLQSRSKRMAAMLGVTGPQRLVLRIVGRFPGILAGQLALILHLHPSTLTGVFRRLERRGLITRRRDPRDGRRAALGLTEAGRRLDGATADSIESELEAVLSTLPPRTIGAARDVLRALATRLSEPKHPTRGRAGRTRDRRVAAHTRPPPVV
jgi:MarR family transcriptional regulator, organic hydroperoxide resistance regulator